MVIVDVCVKGTVLVPGGSHAQEVCRITRAGCLLIAAALMAFVACKSLSMYRIRGVVPAPLYRESGDSITIAPNSGGLVRTSYTYGSP